MTTSHQEQRFPQQGEIDGYWDWDKIHAPRVLTPLAGDAVVMAMGEGFTQAQGELGSPLALKCRMVNYYFYAAFAPQEGSESSEARYRRYLDSLERVVPEIGERWINEWEPAVKPILDKARSTDFAAMSDAQLRDAFEEQLANLIYLWKVHGFINFILVPSSQITEFYNEELKPEDPTEAYQLLQGYHTKSIDAGRGLWRLSRVVKNSAALRKVFTETEPKALVAALEGSDEGRAFLADLRNYLDEFGWRSDGIYEIGGATWREEPSIPLNTIQGYLQLGEDASPEHIFERAVKRREELVAKARTKLAGAPEKLARFNTLLEASKHNLRVTEDHSYWIDQMGTASFRRFMLAVGERLRQKGLIAAAEDVFLLYKDEVRDVLKNGGDRKPLLAQRRREMDEWAKVVPPDHLGDPTPAGADDPFFVAVVDKMLGLLPVEPSSDPAVIKGVAASPGVVQGTAKVVRSLVEASKLQKGDIMVCEMTVPTWTPLFSTVSAVVADSGGILSHCAIVCREYHLPSVVGTRVGTALIKDGMKITVDGTKGIVRIEQR